MCFACDIRFAIDMRCGARGFISYRNHAKHGYIEFLQGKNISNGRSPYIDWSVVMESKNQLREDALNYAIAVSDICDEIKGCYVYINQLLRCSSSIGANIFEARYAQSKADFINKLEIALKESYETEYWLELLFRKRKIDENQFRLLKDQCGSIRRRLIASVTTAKGSK